MSSDNNRQAYKINGFAMVLIDLLLIGGIITSIALSAADAAQNPDFVTGAINVVPPMLMALLFILTMPGYLPVQPNESRVLLLFGSYSGLISESGFWWVNPFTTRIKVSQRVNNFNSDKLKVNDLNGNPIEIAAVISWKVIDPASAVLDVEKYSSYVSIQSEAVIRTISSKYPYESHENEAHESLRASSEQISQEMQELLSEKLKIAGVAVLEARISHLAYAQEIAQAMLKRQQAEAIIMARKKIVEGAVGMVEMALHQLSERNIVSLDDEKKATMVNNLMVALVSEKEAQPIINTGSIY